MTPYQKLLMSYLTPLEQQQFETMLKIAAELKEELAAIDEEFASQGKQVIA